MKKTQGGPTPGPWKVNLHRFKTSVDGPDGLPIALSVVSQSDEYATSANARLIAAAPDLLSAAKMALRKMNTFDAKLHDTLVDAISKATGAEGTGAW